MNGIISADDLKMGRAVSKAIGGTDNQSTGRDIAHFLRRIGDIFPHEAKKLQKVGMFAEMKKPGAGGGCARL